MDLETAIRLVMENQIGIHVVTKEEAQVVIECAQRLPGTEKFALFNADLYDVPNIWSIFGHGSGEFVLTWWRDNGVFAGTHDLVEAASLLCEPLDSSAVADLL